MDDIQRKKFKEFLIMLNDIMVDFALLLTLASELYDDFSAEAMITQENNSQSYNDKRGYYRNDRICSKTN